MPSLQRGQLAFYGLEFVDAEAELFPVASGRFVCRFRMFIQCPSGDT